ncbi:hypothetical protein GJA_2711 [Janthinobacterium agaricidamnosum NBRC 102515 = DSM 9628]|uniref:Uncharacterized protein n=1 Tax=Janthinobacterium agaricidamnosum NBRC 102515 = DSM 9628 TaxID=1349767 RepID=W0V7U4_9BURK|nr:hypothetical protein GJA_2711 [Janthinobacterium agaricidamnosum NBRC 102515 = DSM 9628]
MPVMAAHHYAIFDFNTVEPPLIDARAEPEHDGQFGMFRGSRAGLEPIPVVSVFCWPRLGSADQA